VHAFELFPHAVPVGRAGFEQVPLVVSQVPALWHESGAAHVTGLVPVHAPNSHTSACVHAFPSLQVVPSGAFGLEQTPVDGSHIPAAWHWSAAEQVTGSAPAHTPLTHASTVVHALPSLQATPSGRTGFEHVPVVGLHVPAAWHWSTGAHVTGFDPAHVPAEQTYV
jgi:hypothetical protein